MNWPPSRLLEVEDSLAAYCLDGAVVTFGTIIENALQERVEIGEGKHKERKPKYTLRQLLDPTFRLPRTPSERTQRAQGIGATLRAWIGRGVKLLKEGTNGADLG